MSHVRDSLALKAGKVIYLSAAALGGWRGKCRPTGRAGWEKSDKQSKQRLEQWQTYVTVAHETSYSLVGKYSLSHTIALLKSLVDLFDTYPRRDGWSGQTRQQQWINRKGSKATTTWLAESESTKNIICWIHGGLRRGGSGKILIEFTIIILSKNVFMKIYQMWYRKAIF